MALLVDAGLRGGTKNAVILWIVVAWVCEPYTAFAWPGGAVSGWLGALATMPKIVPLLGVFFLLVRDGLGLPWLGRTGPALPAVAAVSAETVPMGARARAKTAKKGRRSK